MGEKERDFTYHLHTKVNSTPLQSPGSLIEKEKMGDQIKENDIVDQEEVGSHNLESSRPVESPGSLIDKEEKGDQIKEKDMVDQEEVGSHNLESSRPVESPGSLIDKEEKGDQIKEKDMVDQEEVGSHNLESSRPVESPGSLIDEEEKGDQIKEKDMVDQEEVGSHNLPTTSVSNSLEIFDRCLREENRMQKMHLLKNYDMLKEELNWPDIMSIADDLYTNGHLHLHEWLNILDRWQPRRKAIDILLKAVLRNASSVSAFMKIMKSKSSLSYIAMRINTTQISAEEMERFDHLEKITQGQRPSIYQEPSQKFHFSDSDVGFLIGYFYEKEEVIDQISDMMLSNFLISTRDHTGIFEHAHMDGKIFELTKLIKTCPDGVYDIFIEVLMKNNMQYVLKNLERNRIPDMKRKYLSFDPANPPVQKRMKINHNQKGSALDALEKIASGLRVSTIRQKLGNEARKHLDLEFREAFWGSLGLMFSFQVGEPVQKLKQLVA